MQIERSKLAELRSMAYVAVSTANNDKGTSRRLKNQLERIERKIAEIQDEEK